MQTSLSICLIIRDEGKNLCRCLSSVKNNAAEIIVIDTGSSDDSIAIAREFSNHVYSYQWTNDFSSARNFGLEKANGEWILVIDGDEELPGGCLDLLQEKIQVKEAEAYFINIKSDSDINLELQLIPDMQLRLFRNNPKYRFKGIVNEKIIDSIKESNPGAAIECLDNIFLIHHGYNDENHAIRLERKIQLLEQVYRQEENQQTRHFYLGCEYYRHHCFTQALEHFSENSNDYNSKLSYTPELISYYSICLYMLGRVSEAIGLIDQALEQLGDINEWYYLQGYFSKTQGDYLKAYEAFKKSLILKYQPLNKAGTCQYKYRIYYYLGGLAEYFMDKDEALSFYLESLKMNPYELDSLRRMVAILNPRLNPDYTIQALNRVFDLSDAALQLELAVIFYDEGAYRLALNCIELLQETGCLTEKAILIKSLCLLGSRQFLEAEEQLGLINQQDLYIAARQHLLIYYWFSDNDQKAAQCLQEITDAGADPELITILNMLSGRYQNKKKLTGDSKSYLYAKEIISLLVQFGDSSQTVKAFKNFESVLGKRPSPLLAELFYKWGEYDLALKEFGSLLEIDSQYAWALYYLGKIHWHQGNLNEAGSCLCQAIKLGLNTPKVRLEITRLRQEQAMAELNEYYLHCPADPKQENVISQLEQNLVDV